MDTTTHKADSAHLNPAHEAFEKFEICNGRALGNTGINAVHELLPMIYSISTLIEMGHHKDIRGDAALDNMNPELIASAFAGIAYLAGLAMFHADNL